MAKQSIGNPHPVVTHRFWQLHDLADFLRGKVGIHARDEGEKARAEAEGPEQASPVGHEGVVLDLRPAWQSLPRQGRPHRWRPCISSPGDEIIVVVPEL